VKDENSVSIRIVIEDESEACFVIQNRVL